MAVFRAGALVTCAALGLAGCGTAPVVDAVQPAPPQLGFADTGSALSGPATLTWTRLEGAVSYRIDVAVTDACHFAGPRSASSANSPDGAVQNIAVSTTVAQNPGSCAPVLGTVSFEDRVPLTAQAFTMTARVADARTGSVTVITP